MLTYKELKKEKLDHFYFNDSNSNLKIDVVAANRLYFEDEPLPDTAQDYLKLYGKDCYRTDLKNA